MPRTPVASPSAEVSPVKRSPSQTLTAPQKALRKLNLVRNIDLALHLPLRYEDETRITRLRDARDGHTVQIEAQVTHSEVTFRPRRQLLVTVDDGSDTCMLRFFNFYPSQQKTLSEGARIRARGELRGGFAGWHMLHPVFRLAGGELPQALTPIYPTVAGLPQPYLRRVVLAGLGRADLAETLPNLDLLPVHGSEPDPFSSQIAHQPRYTLLEALSFLHQPTPDVAMATLEDRSHPAWQRLKAEELLAQQLSQLQSRRERDALQAPLLVAPEPAALPHQLLAALPFGLTAAQHRVSRDIAHNMAQRIPMHRLLQGDVGSGKTVVAALAAAICIESGHQCALMVPTEILAEQHFRKLIGWLEPLLEPRNIRIAWLTGSQKKKERTAMLALIASGEAGLVVGTHAVIQDSVVFKNLALAIIDEQHRFGVQQRLALREKMRVPGQEPHLLMMTATPIPRTLAMSYYADLDVSTIDELPPGRTPIVTKLVSNERRDEVVARIRTQLAKGRQVYWVCPLIEESETLDLTNATETHAALSKALSGQAVNGASEVGNDASEVGNDASVMVGLLHSRMPPAEKKAVMSLFVSGHMQVLVSTTVIEVGVDVPNASLMVIEHAERFGLSQLHQLRGRVGRGAAASACILLFGTPEGGRLGDVAKARLKAMVETQDGFEIARRDLDIRGPGEFLGARQSGAALLRFADLATDGDLLDWAKALAPRMLDEHPDLAERHLDRWLGGRVAYLKA